MNWKPGADSPHENDIARCLLAYWSPECGGYFFYLVGSWLGCWCIRDHSSAAIRGLRTPDWWVEITDPPKPKVKR